MHLADAFIQSDLHCIQVTVSTFDQLIRTSLHITAILVLIIASAILFELDFIFNKLDFLVS